MKITAADAHSGRPGARRLVAEFEPQAAVWMAWPHNAADYPPKATCIPWVYAEMLRVLQARERVRLLVRDAREEARIRSILRRTGVDAAATLDEDGAPWLEFHHQPTNRAWARDFLPAFVHDADGQVEAIHFRFTGWGLYPNHLDDVAAPPALAPRLGWKLAQAMRQGRHVVLEGGGIDGNGQGVLLTTEECYLDETDQPRNPGYSRQDYEAVFAEWLGIRQTIWLGHGIAGDDTHGHVDDLCRFVNPHTVVLAVENNPADVNHRPLAENRERLQGVSLPDGATLQVVELPMPDALAYEGRRLPASHANFLICNRTVLVPTFNSPSDRQALGILAELFPHRRVVGVHSGDLIMGYGAIHCLSHEEPRPAL